MSTTPNPRPRRLSITSTAPAPAAPAPTGERVTLAVPHTHAGQRYPAGAILTVDAPTAAWLRRVGVVKTPAAPAIDKE